MFKNGFYITIDNTGMDEFFFDDQASIKSNPYYISNISFGYKIINWNLSIWGKNILNEKYTTRGYYFDLGIGQQGDQAYKAYGNPAHFGINLEYTL